MSVIKRQDGDKTYDVIDTRVDGTTTYGIQLRDLWAATGQQFRDLMLLHIAKRGLDGEPGVDCDAIVNDETGEVIRVAFHLGGAGINSEVMPIPAGWRAVRITSGAKAGDKGEIIPGCKPWWNIWADGVNLGRSIETNGSGTTATARFSYNVFRPLNGDRPDLKHWKGFNISLAHEPKGIMRGVENGEYPIEWHNGVAFKCAENSSANMPDYILPSRSVKYDELIFVHEKSSPASIEAAFGNLINWDNDSGLPWWVGNVKQNANAQIKAVGVRLMTSSPERWISYANESDTNGFGASTPEDKKKQIRDGLDPYGRPYNWVISDAMATEFGWTMYDDLFNVFNPKGTTHDVNSRLNLYMLADKGNTEEFSVDNVVTPQDVMLKGSVNPKQSEYNDDGFRFILRTQYTQSGLEFREAVGNTTSALRFNNNPTSPSMRVGGIGAQLCLSSRTGTKKKNMNSERLLAVWDIHMTDANGDIIVRRIANYTALACNTIQPSSTSVDELYGTAMSMSRWGEYGFLGRSQWADGTEMGDDWKTSFIRAFVRNDELQSGEAVADGWNAPQKTTAELYLYEAVQNRHAFVVQGTPIANTTTMYVQNSNVSYPYLVMQRYFPAVSNGNALTLRMQRYASLTTSDAKGTLPTYSYTIKLTVRSTGTEYTATVDQTTKSATFGSGFAYATIGTTTQRGYGMFPNGYPQNNQQFFDLEIRVSNPVSNEIYDVSITINS